MTKKSWLLAAALVSACACVPPVPSMQAIGGKDVQVQRLNTRKADYCGASRCTVVVSVDSSCAVTVEPYALVLGGDARHEVEVTWKIDGDAQFAKDGIVFKESEGRNVFTLKQAGRDKFVFHDSGDNGIYHYGVKVVQGGHACPALDPTGINDM